MRIVIVAFAVALACGAAVAQGPSVAPVQVAPSAAQAAGAGYADGEVRRVDKEAQKVTLRHGPIQNLGMSDMTMVFRVSDPKLLEDVKPGDKVRFKADKIGGQYTVTAIEPAK